MKQDAELLITVFCFLTGFILGYLVDKWTNNE